MLLNLMMLVWVMLLFNIRIDNINSNVTVRRVAYSVESPGLLCLWQCIGMFSRTYYCCTVIKLIQIKILYAKYQESSAPFLNYDEPVTSFHCNA